MKTIEEKMTEFINENYTHPHTEWYVLIHKHKGIVITDDCCEIVLDLDSVYNCLTTCKGYGLDWNNVYNCYEIMRDKEKIVDFYKNIEE